MEKGIPTIGVEYQLVSIVGESVSFVPTGLSPSETAIVEFEPYYRPDGLSNKDYEILVKTMRVLFDGKRKAIADPKTGEDSEEFTKVPLPPCSEKEKYLVLDSLLHRKRILFQQLYDLGILTPDEIKKKLDEMKASGKDESLEGKDSLLVRTHLLHLLRLEQFIQRYVENQQCINLEDIVYGALQLNLDDEQIKELLKQFVFFLLQSNHPLKDYTKVHPTAPAFVSRLQKNLLKDKFPGFLQTYRNNQFPIPPTIAKVLEATDLDPQAMREQIYAAIRQERKRIYVYLQKYIPSTDPFWQRLAGSKNPSKIIDAFLEERKELQLDIDSLQTEKADLEKRLETCTKAQQALAAEKARLDAQVKAMEEELRGKAGVEAQLTALQEQKAAVDAQLAARDVELAQQRRVCDERIRELEAANEALEFQNQDLKQEIFAQRNQLEDLEGIEEKAERDIAALREEYRLALETEAAKLRTETDRATAAEADVAAKVVELASAQAERDAQRALVAARDTTIGQLQKALSDCTANEETARSQLAAKTEEARRLAAELQTSNATIADLNSDLSEISGELSSATADMKEIEDSLRGQLDELNAKLAAEIAKNRDLDAEKKACDAQLASLSSGASASTQEIAKLRGDLQKAEGERDAAKAREEALSAEIESLRAAVNAAEADAASQRETVAQRDATIGELTDTLKAAQNDLGEQAAKAAAAEARAGKAENNVARVEGEKRALIADADKRLSETAATLQGVYESTLEQTKEIYEAKIREIGEAAETALRQRTEEAQRAADARARTSEEAQAASEEEKNKVLAIVNEIATWIDTGSEPLEIEEGSPASDEFSKIVQKLSESSGPSTPTSEQAKKDNALNQCYLIFLASFLWQANFPPLPAAKPTEEIAKQSYERQEKILLFYTTLLNGGKDPRVKVSATIPGVYEQFASAHRGMLRINVIRLLFRLLFKLSQVIESGPVATIPLAADEKAMLTKLTQNIESFSTWYKMHEHGSLVQYTTDYVMVHQPKINPTFLNRFIVLTAEGPSVVEKTTRENPSFLNYSVLFYCYLVAIRDYLNHIKATVERICPLPTILQK